MKNSKKTENIKKWPVFQTEKNNGVNFTGFFLVKVHIKLVKYAQKFNKVLYKMIFCVNIVLTKCLSVIKLGKSFMVC